jgi:hypothetical protein
MAEAKTKAGAAARLQYCSKLALFAVPGRQGD